jgi:hypothetical protein
MIENMAGWGNRQGRLCPNAPLRHCDVFNPIAMMFMHVGDGLKTISSPMRPVAPLVPSMMMTAVAADAVRRPCVHADTVALRGLHDTPWFTRSVRLPAYVHIEAFVQRAAGRGKVRDDRRCRPPGGHVCQRGRVNHLDLEGWFRIVVAISMQ